MCKYLFSSLLFVVLPLCIQSCVLKWNIIARFGVDERLAFQPRRGKRKDRPRDAEGRPPSASAASVVQAAGHLQAIDAGDAARAAAGVHGRPWRHGGGAAAPATAVGAPGDGGAAAAADDGAAATPAHGAPAPTHDDPRVRRPDAAPDAAAPDGRLHDAAAAADASTAAEQPGPAQQGE